MSTQVGVWEWINDAEEGWRGGTETGGQGETSAETSDCEPQGFTSALDVFALGLCWVDGHATAEDEANKANYNILESAGDQGTSMTKQIWSTINTLQSIDKIWAGLIRWPNKGKEGSCTDTLTDRIAAYDMIIS